VQHSAPPAAVAADSVRAETTGAAPRPGSATDQAPDHSELLALLRREDADQPLQRAQVAGAMLFDMVYRLIANDKGARVENIVAILASTGGFSCIVAAMDIVRRAGRDPADAGLMQVATRDGRRYYFGELPNTLLFEYDTALLSLALGTARQLGGRITREVVDVTAQRTAQAVGGDDFGAFQLPVQHCPGDTPENCVRFMWRRVRELLDRYEVPVEQRPIAIGFALQRAISEGRHSLDPSLCAQVAVQCAVPAARLDPDCFDRG